jgi:hypothetical protein
MSSEEKADDPFAARRSGSHRRLLTLAAILSLVAGVVAVAVLVGRSGRSTPAERLGLVPGPVLLASDAPGYRALPASAALSVAITRASRCAGVAGSRSRAFALSAIQGYEGMQSQASGTGSSAAAATVLAPMRRARLTACMTAALKRIAALGPGSRIAFGSPSGGRLVFGSPSVTRPPFAVSGGNDDIDVTIALTAATTQQPVTDYLELRGFVVGRTAFALTTFSLAHGFPNILSDQLAQVLVRRVTSPASQTPSAPTEPAPVGGLAAAIGIDDVAEGVAAQAQSAAGNYADAHGGSFAAMTPAALQAAGAQGAVPIDPNFGMPYISKVTATAATYAITVHDPANTYPETFTIHRAANATITHTCTPDSGTHGACLNGSW